MHPILLVGLGGFVGSVLRYLAGTSIQSAAAPSLFPYGTTAVNLVGCLAIGFLSGLAETREVFSPEVRLLLLVGVLGGFTTFSTFGLETVHLLRAGHGGFAVANVGVQVVLGIAAVWGGFIASRLV